MAEREVAARITRTRTNTCTRTATHVLASLLGPVCRRSVDGIDVPNARGDFVTRSRSIRCSASR